MKSTATVPTVPSSHNTASTKSKYLFTIQNTSVHHPWTMPPYSSPFRASGHDDGDFGRVSNRAAGVTGFSSALLETIAVSKSKMEEWAQREMAKADAVAESYHQRLLHEQAEIDARSTELLAIQMERGMKIAMDTATAAASEDESNDNIVSRKQALEEQATALQIEIMKLTTERDNRQRRIRGKIVATACQSKSNVVVLPNPNTYSLFIHVIIGRHFLGRKEAADACSRSSSFQTTSGRRQKDDTGRSDSRSCQLQNVGTGLCSNRAGWSPSVSWKDPQGGFFICDLCYIMSYPRIVYVCHSFCYTKLDPNDPSREFSFLLIVDEDDKFDIVECQPAMEATELVDILTELNRTEDMASLARRMRKSR
jgi:Chromosome segregation protein Spc25